MKFILLINVKVPTVVVIIAFISKINATSESIKNVFIFFILVTIDIKLGDA